MLQENVITHKKSDLSILWMLLLIIQIERLNFGRLDTMTKQSCKHEDGFKILSNPEYLYIAKIKLFRI